MIRTSAVVLALLVTVGGDGIASAQTAPTGQPPARSDTSGMAGDKAKNAEGTPKAPDAAGTVDVSPGVGAIEGVDGSPPIPSGARK